MISTPIFSPLSLLAAALALTGVTAPAADRSYPPFADRQACIAAAVDLSTRLEHYIKDWMDGKVPAKIPNELLPLGMDPHDFHDFTLMRPEDVSAEQQWGQRLSSPIDPAGLQGYFPDPHVTYLVPGTFYAPFGSTMVIDGQFPHARYFSVQVPPPFDPNIVRYSLWAGAPEVPLADVDIDPLPGHVNPFRPGADRNATQRSYHVELQMVVGDPALTEPAYHGPDYRAPGNRRFGSAIAYQGPWGTQDGGHKRGPFDMGQLWVRYYAPDLASGPLGGVPLPKMYWRLPDGRTYWIQCDYSNWISRANRRVAMRWTFGEEPAAGDGYGPAWGWDKKFGIFRSVVAGGAIALHLLDQKGARDLDHAVTFRGEDETGANHLEQSATTCSHVNYLTRGMAINWGKVAVVTGTVPRTPRTRAGQATLTSAEARYWSITTYDPAFPLADGYCGAAISSVMDEDLVLDAQNRYIIVYSRAEDRPANAISANGVTWVEWGTTSNQAITLRWLSVLPDWSFPLTPHEGLVGWEGSWPSASFDRRVVGENHHRGRLLSYLPRFHYLAKAGFEALGARLTPDAIPLWGTEPTARTVRGRITRDGAGIGGVAVGDGVRQAVSDANGDYELPTIADALVIRPRQAGTTFSPVNRAIDSRASDVGGADFAITAAAPVRPQVEVELTGRVGQGIVSLTIGGFPVRPGPDGTWQARIPVPVGAVSVPLIGRDALGAETLRTVTLLRPAGG